MHKTRCIITDEQQTVGILLMEHGEPNHVAAILEYARLQMLAPPFMGRWNPTGLASFISYIMNYAGRGKVKIVVGPFPVTPDDEGIYIIGDRWNAMEHRVADSEPRWVTGAEIRRIRHAIDRAQPRRTRLFNAVDSELVPIPVLRKGYQILIPTGDGPVPATITDIGYGDDGEGRITVDCSGTTETCTPGRMAWLIPGKKEI